MTVEKSETKTDAQPAFRGTKLFLFIGERLAVLLRDDKPDIPWPDYWDFPGGEAEPGETPEACVLRETAEELGLEVRLSALEWSRQFPSSTGVPEWFFAAHLPEERGKEIVLGDEGQGWALMAPEEYITHPKAIPHFAERLAMYLKERGV